MQIYVMYSFTKSCLGLFGIMGQSADWQLHRHAGLHFSIVDSASNLEAAVFFSASPALYTLLRLKCSIYIKTNRKTCIFVPAQFVLNTALVLFDQKVEKRLNYYFLPPVLARNMSLCMDTMTDQHSYTAGGGNEFSMLQSRAAK